MSRILLITPFAPSNIGAAMKFTKNVIETLAKSHIVDIIYFIAEGEKEYIPNNSRISIIKTYKIGFINRLLSVIQKPMLYPIFSTRYRRDLKKILKKKFEENKYDLLFLDHSQTFLYGKLFPETPKILMSHDVIFQRVSRNSNKIISAFCHYSEYKMMNQSNAYIFSFSTKDQDIIKTEYALQSFVTSGNVDNVAQMTYPTEIENNFVFFGQWVRKDNLDGLQWFLEEVYPIADYNYNYLIIGRGLPDYMKEKIERYPNIQYLGFVDNPYQIIANSKAVLSPLFTGAGVKFKVLEALACGTPVIGNEITFEGIPMDYSTHMLYANSVNEYINVMNSINHSITERLAMKNKFLAEYINPYIIKHINNII